MEVVVSNDRRAMTRGGQAAEECFADQPGAGAIIGCPSTDRHWVELQVVDTEGHPAANLVYWVRLPDGSEREGKLDKDGFTRLEGVADGHCAVRFENVDRQEWHAPPRQTTKAQAEHTSWIEIELKDDQSQPVAGQSYHLTSDDGQVRRGNLNKQGFAKEVDLAAGNHTISFPKIDGRDLTQA